MANRSYLYSTNIVPSADVKNEERRIVGISEWNYDIPLVFRILLSGNPRKCQSSIWVVPEEIALVGEYDQGTARLFQFLDRISHPAIIPLREEARQFLSSARNKNLYFVLECGEIFEMQEGSLIEQNSRLLAEIQNLEPAMALAIDALSVSHAEKPKSVGFFARLFGAKPTASKTKTNNPTEALNSLGLGNWSNILYFDLSST